MPDIESPLARIGILGGMGAEATIELMRRVLEATAAEDDHDHVPMFVDMNPQVPSRISFILERTGPDPGPILAAMARRLEVAGAQALAMPCNTAHLYAREIEAAVGIPLLNMPKLACDALASQLRSGDKVGILASPATNGTGLFSDLLSPWGIEAIYPEDEREILRSIRRIKQGGPSQSDIEALEQAAVDLATKGAACLIVGCSEFSLVSRQLNTAIPVLDTLDVLALEIIATSGAATKPGHGRAQLH